MAGSTVAESLSPGERYSIDVKTNLWNSRESWVNIGKGPDIERMVSGMCQLFHSAFHTIVTPFGPVYPNYKRRETRLSLQGIGSDISIIETRAIDESRGYVVVNLEEVGIKINPDIYKRRIEGALTAVWDLYAHEDTRRELGEKVIDFNEMIAGFAWWAKK